jgi:hypothetical protein
VAEEKNGADARRRSIIEGCVDMTEVYLQIEREFHPLDEEVDRLIGDCLAEEGSEYAP